MTDARHDDDSDDALPPETLAALRAAWGELATPAPTRELAAEDEATRRAIGWMKAAWRSPGVVAPCDATALHAPLALRAAHRARGVPSDADRAPLRLTGWRRQVAAAAILIALLGAALLMRDVLGVAAGKPAPRIAPQLAVDATAPVVPPPEPRAEPPPEPRVVTTPAPHVPAPGAPRDGTPGSRATQGLLAAGHPPPIELRAGHTRVLLFTDSVRRIQENQP